MVGSSPRRKGRKVSKATEIRKMQQKAMTTENEQDRYTHARENALAAMASIREMVARLEHAQTCDGGEDCEYDITDFAGLDSEDYHDGDAAREAIEEDALSVEVRGGWHSPGEDADDEEFMILLTTGGPALRIVGELGEWNTPKRPRLEMQDWFVPWQEVILDSEDQAILLAYCEVFYFGD